jgi:hypothetical protein
LPFLQGAAAGLDHHHQEDVGVFTRGALGRTVDRIPGAMRGIGFATTVARGTTTTVRASAGTAIRTSITAASLFILNLLLCLLISARPSKHAKTLRGSPNASNCPRL